MSFYADLHIHSKYSRATSRDCDLEHLSWWAQRKGIQVVATGDFTHPAWWEELRSKLVPAEPGLFRLRPDVEREVASTLPGPCRLPTRFLLEVEISTIYKKGDKTRKIHHLIYAGDFATAGRFRDRLGSIGNIRSDGRPILGLDSRHLLEITLESGPDAYLVPAHIWTPWFAVLGSKGGFDAIEECYGDLSNHIFAVETGLSSDPPMNWRVSALDRYTLVSNSDAHSPPKLGREACVFDTELDYFAMRKALESGERFGGTVEFFPEEGKYHLDGHRACGVVLEPAQTRSLAGRCPTCGKALTVGVMHRVEELADRPGEERPQTTHPFRSLVPLDEVVSELTGVGPKSKTVGRAVSGLVQRLGPELSILESTPLEEVERAGDPVLVEALRRLRQGKVRCQAGYDGEYGVIRLFEPGELEDRKVVAPLFDPPPKPPAKSLPTAVPEAGRTHRPPAASGELSGETQDLEPSTSGAAPAEPSSPAGKAAAEPEGPGGRAPAEPKSPAGEAPAGSVSPATATPGETETPGETPPAPAEPSPGARSARRKEPSAQRSLFGPPEEDDGGPTLLDELDQDQRAAASVPQGPVLIVAGPGTGKTRTLTHRLAWLVAEGKARPGDCLAVTFSRRAAAELSQRLESLLPHRVRRVTVTTFHGLGLKILREEAHHLGLSENLRIADERTRGELAAQAFAATGGRKASRKRATAARKAISRARREGTEDADLQAAAAAYEEALRSQGLVDFDDLLLLPLRLFDRSEEWAGAWQKRFPWVFVDEYQDVDPLQYRLVRHLAPPGANLCAIGDPDQSIYRFRGADVGFFLRFRQDYPGARVLHLARNYRSSPTIVEAAAQAIRPGSLVPDRRLVAAAQSGVPTIVVHEAATARAEAEHVVHTIERLLGGTSYFSVDSGRLDGDDDDDGSALSFEDFAVLYRTDAQAAALIEALGRAGMPFQKRSHRRLAELPEVRCLVERLEEALAAGGGDAAEEDERPPTLLQRLEQAANRAVNAAAAAPSSTEGDDEGAAGAFAGAAGAARLAAALELLSPLAQRYGRNLEGFLAELALGVEVDTWDPRAERVTLMTLHAAKGLEFPIVFLVGCEEGLLPFSFPGENDEEARAEERRLFFVGLTRAEQRLYLSYARRRMVRGEVQERRPSPFLADIEEALLHRQAPARQAEKASQAKQLKLL